MNGLLATARLVPFMDTRQRRRVSSRISHLAGVFAIAFARIHAGRRVGFLVESPSIPWIATVLDGTTGRRIRDGFAGDYVLGGIAQVDARDLLARRLSRQ